MRNVINHDQGRAGRGELGRLVMQQCDEMGQTRREIMVKSILERSSVRRCRLQSRLRQIAGGILYP